MQMRVLMDTAIRHLTSHTPLPSCSVTHLSEVLARGLHVVVSRRANSLMYASIRTSLAVQQYTAYTTIITSYGLNSAWYQV
jgi:hypothetical protein